MHRAGVPQGIRERADMPPTGTPRHTDYNLYATWRAHVVWRDSVQSASPYRRDRTRESRASALGFSGLVTSLRFLYVKVSAD